MLGGYEPSLALTAITLSPVITGPACTVWDITRIPCSPLTEWMRAPTPTTEASTSTRPTTSSDGRGRQGRGAMRVGARPRGASVRGVGSMGVYPAVMTLAI